jgi:hypothetical protein
MAWLWWAPFVAATLHIIEEFVFPGGFAAWDRTYRPAIRKSITGRFHVLVNAALLLLCLQIAFLARAADAAAQRIGVAAWLAVSVLLVSNAVFHVVGTWRTRTYSPGVVTGIFLYVPLAVLGYWHFLSTGRVSWPVAAVAATVGGSYHAWAALLHKARAHRAMAGASQQEHSTDGATRRH